ncbi:MAG: 2-C-methyl-D-erythritol 2,4-cyclodiphosphate synthase [Actinomycetota bacterium]|nr:2-C-methyl-D-erythritol 2,4-cyclodiphosphate synthase [Actinomycetota bacterium]
MSETRVGLGFDVHAAQEGRTLHLGGVTIPDAPGLAGHSDGDVVCHAVADAVLGAAGLGDIGQHFPETDSAFEGIGGLDLLGRVVAMARDGGCAVSSCDITVIAERPAVAPIRDEMRVNLARVLGTTPDRTSVKATRPEGLGLTGEGVGCIALAVLDLA